ncbi:hypothetical protein F5880DRAFT_1504255 [Lentinula raphanica]|nr:hypothetical protein F5880DRAFT_1504255 [Lentinula raphanica]
MRLSTASFVFVVLGLFSTATVHSVPVVSLEARKEGSLNTVDWSMLTEKAKITLKGCIEKYPLRAGFRRLGEISPSPRIIAQVLPEAQAWVKDWLIQEFGQDEVVSKMNLQFESYTWGALMPTLEFFLREQDSLKVVFYGAVSTAEKEKDSYIVGAMAATTDLRRKSQDSSSYYPTSQDLIIIRDSHRAASQGLGCSSSTTILISCKN